MFHELKKLVHHRASLWIGGVLASAIATFMIGKSQQEGPRPPAPVVPAVPGPTERASPDVPLDYDAIYKEAQLILHASLKESGSTIRAQGAEALGKIQDSQSATALTGLIETDPDDDMRGYAAHALATIGAGVAPRLAKLETTAPPLLKISYASALARLGDKEASRRLLEYARSKELTIAYKAGLALADISQLGDMAAIAALRALAARETDLDKIAPHGQVLILTRMAALRDANARKVLYALLDDKDEGTRLAAAEGLAKLGDDAGRKVLREMRANKASPNWLAAVPALIPLGEIGDVDLITAKLADPDPGIRRLAARALGEIGDRRSLSALRTHVNDRDWTVRIAVATAIVTIVGLDPQVLAKTSVDWVKHALTSHDRAERQAAAGVLADIPEKIGLRLLAKASVDPDPRVRRDVAESAGKMRSSDAAAAIAVAVTVERDPDVKEQQVKALGEIGHPSVHDTLARIAEEPGRIGVLAAGSLIAIGDPAGKAKLDAAIASPQVELRLAAVQAAVASKNPIVIPTLKIGVLDHVFEVRFSAAEGLSIFKAAEGLAVPVLTSALESEDAGVVGRALASLIRFGKTLIAKVQRPVDMLDSMDPKRRLATMPIVRALPPSEGVPLLRRLVADPDREVRHASVEAIGAIATQAPAQAIELYRPLVHDADPVVRAKASGQLARLLPPMRPPPDSLLGVKQALDEVIAAAADARTAGKAFDALADDIAMKTAAASPEEAVIKQIPKLAAKLDEMAAQLTAAATRADLASQTASDAAGVPPSPAAAKLVDEAKVLAQGALDAASVARGRRADLASKAQAYLAVDVQVLLDGAAALIATGNLPEAKQRLDKAASLLPSGTEHAGLVYAYAQFYDRMSERAQDLKEKRKLLQQALEAYQRFTKIGTGPRVGLANDRTAEIIAELQELGPP